MSVTTFFLVTDNRGETLTNGWRIIGCRSGRETGVRSGEWREKDEPRGKEATKETISIQFNLYNTKL